MGVPTVDSCPRDNDTNEGDMFGVVMPPRSPSSALASSAPRVSVIGPVLLVGLGCGSAPATAPTTAAAAIDGPARPEAAAPQKVVGVATGDFHTCILVVGGSVMCFGRNTDGELGDGGASGNRSKPLAVPNLRDVEQLAAGHGFSCARVKGGKVRCWGSGRILGDDQSVERVRPAEVAGLSDVVDIKAGGLVACAKTTSGAVRCWGTDGIKKGAPSAGADEIAVAGAHACARTLDRQIVCWGEGLARNPKQSGPDTAKAVAIATGDSFVCAVVEGGVRCWGRNDQGELGMRADTETRTKPVVVKGLTGVAKITAAEARACVLSKDGMVRCWGSNNEGELGRGIKSPFELPAPVSGLTSVVDIAMGAGHACALLPDGVLNCWGGNRQGQLGDGTLETRPSPVRLRF